MGKQAVIMDPDEFRDFTNELTERLCKKLEEEMNKRGTIVDQPMTREQTARFLHCSVPTIDRYVKSGFIKPHKVGRVPMFFASELVEAIKKKTQKP